MKFSKLLILAPVAILAACSNTPTSAPVSEATYGSYTESQLRSGANVVYFDFDKYDIKPQFQQLLNAHALYLQDKAGSVVIEGHADERGTPEYNIALGQKRADAVERYLEAQGVDSNKLRTLSYGEEKPAVLGHDEASYEQNRRAVLSY